MKNILIGSRALAYWNPELSLKDGTDWDVISDKPIEGTEWHDPEFLNNADFEIFTYDNHTIDFNGHTLYIVSMEGLAIIKRSHLWRDYKFQSHITQYYKFGLSTAFNNAMRYNQWSGKTYIPGTYEKRLRLTHEAFPKQHPNLNSSSTDFFNDAVTRKYDHDMLHELVAYGDEPLYKKLLVSQDKVFCSQEKWDTFSVADKINCIAEETMVTALERFIIPDLRYPFKHAYIKSLDKVCTTMCSGWFRDFAIDNYPAIVDKFDKEPMLNALKKLGEIK